MELTKKEIRQLQALVKNEDKLLQDTWHDIPIHILEYRRSLSILFEKLENINRVIDKEDFELDNFEIFQLKRIRQGNVKDSNDVINQKLKDNGLVGVWRHFDLEYLVISEAGRNFLEELEEELKLLKLIKDEYVFIDFNPLVNRRLIRKGLAKVQRYGQIGFMIITDEGERILAKEDLLE